MNVQRHMEFIRGYHADPDALPAHSEAVEALVLRRTSN